MKNIKNTFHDHPGAFFVIVEVLTLALFVFFSARTGVSDAIVAALGGAIGAWLNMLDVLSDHKALKVRKHGTEAVARDDVLYLLGRTILGGMSGFVAFNVWGGAAWFAGNFSRLLSLGILAGFSTTTLAKLSKGVSAQDHRDTATNE